MKRTEKKEKSIIDVCDLINILCVPDLVWGF